MATTTYTVFTVDAEGVETAFGHKAKKAAALELAQATRNEQNLAVKVVTQAGTVVAEIAAPKKIKMSPRYSRVVELPEGVVVPEGMRVAYFRPRVGLALLHNAEAPKDEAYAVLDVKIGALAPERFATTRQGGAFLVAKAKAAANA